MRNGWRLHAALLAAVLVGACQYDSEPDDRDRGDAGAGTCAEACEASRRAADGGCPGWRGTPGLDEERGTSDDATCEDVCEDVQAEAAEAPALSLPLGCVSASLSCDEVAACEGG